MNPFQFCRVVRCGTLSAPLLIPGDAGGVPTADAREISKPLNHHFHLNKKYAAA